MVVGVGGYLFKLQNSIQPSAVRKTEPQVATTGAPQLTSQPVVTGLSNIWDVAFIPDGTMIITERAGEISTVKNGKKVSLLKVPGVNVRGEGGLLGLTVDPDFVKNRFIYACYNSQSDIRVSRWKMDISQSILQEQAEIVTGLPQNTNDFPGRHSGCRPRFGADGNLWVGTGDAAIGTSPQDPKSLGGKILRVDRNGKAVDGNLGDPYDSRIYSYGHRNIQGLAMFSAVKNGSYGYNAEHGSDRDDELNHLLPGNFGWDPVPGYNEAVSMTDVQKFPQAIIPVWRSGKPTIAPSGATILTGSQWRDWEGAVALAVQKGRHVRVLQLDNKGFVKDEVKILDSFGRIRSVVMGPNNNLYLATDNGKGEDMVVQVIAK